MCKRALDIVGSLLALALLWPLLLIVALAIRVTMGSPVLFRQDRPGLHGQVFRLSKFRTMKFGDQPDEDRLTRLGEFLRSSSLDELPEFLHIVRGEMSLVGPRPLLPQYLPLYSPRQATRHDVRPGLTGLAQVNGRNAATWDDRLEFDAIYVETQSLLLDLKIIARTVGAVLRRDGISADSEATMPAFEGSEGRPS